MREDQDLMKRFVKIVQKYPDIYDYKLDGYRTKQGEISWERIAETVRCELKEECTVEELKVKWKGVRSSYNRYKHKVLSKPDSIPSCKKYYLYDSLKFLDPFTRLKKTPGKSSDAIFEECCNYVNDTENSGDYDRLDEWDVMDVKPNITTPPPIITETSRKLDNNFDQEILRHDRQSTDSTIDQSRKRRHQDRTDDDCEDLQFFKSILPDIKNFTTKEKRKLKMRILEIIDDIDNERINNTS